MLNQAFLILENEIKGECWKCIKDHLISEDFTNAPTSNTAVKSVVVGKS